MKTGWIPPLRLYSQSLVLSAVLLLAGVNTFMDSVFTPTPPALPADCATSPPAARNPSSSWLADYLGPKPSAPAAPSSRFLGEGWPIPPPGMTLDYLGFQQSLRLDADDFGLTVPGDQIWHMRTVILDYNFGASTATRSLQLEVTGPETSPIFGDYGNTETVTPNAGGNVTWSQGVVNGVTKFNRFVYPLPTPFFLYPAWQIQALINVKPSGDTLNTAYFLYDAFQIVPLGSGGGSNPPPPGGSGALDGGFTWPGPIFKEG